MLQSAGVAGSSLSGATPASLVADVENSSRYLCTSGEPAIGMISGTLSSVAGSHRCPQPLMTVATATAVAIIDGECLPVHITRLFIGSPCSFRTVHHSAEPFRCRSPHAVLVGPTQPITTPGGINPPTDRLDPCIPEEASSTESTLGPHVVATGCFGNVSFWRNAGLLLTPTLLAQFLRRVRLMICLRQRFNPSAPSRTSARLAHP